MYAGRGAGVGWDGEAVVRPRSTAIRHGRAIRRIASSIAAVLVAAALPTAASAAGVTGAPKPPRFTPGAAGIGDPYFPLDGNGGYEVQHYDLKLTYNPATDVLTGEATITAKALQNLSTFDLDYVGPKLKSLTVNGSTAGALRQGQ